MHNLSPNSRTEKKINTKHGAFLSNASKQKIGGLFTFMFMWVDVVKTVMAGPMMDAAFLTYEGITSDPVENYLNLEKPVWILGKYFRPDEGNFHM